MVTVGEGRAARSEGGAGVREALEEGEGEERLGTGIEWCGRDGMPSSGK